MRRALAVVLVLVACSANGSGGSADAAGGGASSGGGFGLGGGTSFEACAPVDAAQDVATDVIDAPTCTPSRTDVHFTADVRPILAGCKGELCHATTWGGPDPWPALVGQPALECCDGREIVRPGDPDHSYMLDKLEDHDLCSGQRMPLQQTPLRPADLQTLYDWICLGALND